MAPALELLSQEVERRVERVVLMRRRQRGGNRDPAEASVRQALRHTLINSVLDAAERELGWLTPN